MTFSDRRRFRSLLPIVSGAIVIALSPEAHAQRSAADIESARQAYNQGIALRDSGDLRAALEKFKAAHALGNTPITGLELCKTHSALHQPVEAREVCLSVARIPNLAGETSRSQDARNEAARVAEEVRPKIATIRMKLVGVPAGREPMVTVDGTAVPNAALGEPRSINPGSHAIGARVGNGPEVVANVELADGQTRDIELRVEAPNEEPTPPPPVAPAPPAEKPTNVLQLVGLGVAGVGIGVGTIGGLVAMSAKSSLDDQCTNGICGREQGDELDRGKTWGNVSTAFFIIGGAGLVVALVGTLSPPSASAKAPPSTRSARSITPTFGVGGAGVHGTF